MPTYTHQQGWILPDILDDDPAKQHSRIAGVPVLTVPRAAELADPQRRNQRVRDIEPEDLLGREPVQLDEAGIGVTLRVKTVLITGAGGSIGSRLASRHDLCPVAERSPESLLPSGHIVLLRAS